MDGRNGKTGWQWLFIINFAMTLPIGLYGFAMFPGTPHTVKAFWLTEEERELCLTRLPPTEHYVITWARFRKSIGTIVTTWRYYLFSSLFMLSATSFEKTGESEPGGRGWQLETDLRAEAKSSHLNSVPDCHHDLRTCSERCKRRGEPAKRLI